MLEVEAGEASKDIEVATGLWLALKELGADRSSLMINLGGGVVCDLGAWVAGNYMRGIEYLHVPTSLLAMVDAAIGGKNGIDLGGIKNLIGSFSKPAFCLVETSFLESLPEEEWHSGYAEMIKHALIADRDQWQILKEIDLKDKNVISDLIEDSSLIKVRIVEEDFRESGLRKILNFGHSIGHGIEALSYENGQALSHGHAIALGMYFETRLSVKLNNLAEEDAEEIMRYLLKIYSMPDWIRNSADQIIAKMRHDKKNKSEEIQLVLLSKIGQAEYSIAVDEEEIRKVLTENPTN